MKIGEQRYPVIYLLHGYGGNHTTWPAIVDLTYLSDLYRVIFVCPDGGKDSWYLDSKVKSRSMYMTYITEELVCQIDSLFPTLPHADGRVIIGSSMGGHGALTILASNPELFSGAGSISGIMDLGEFPKHWRLPRVLGPYKENVALWWEHSFLGMISALQGKEKKIIIHCGTDDFALAGNRRAHQKLEEHSVSHKYVEMPGDHTLDFVSSVFEEQLGFLISDFKDFR